MSKKPIPSVHCTWGCAEDVTVSLEGCPLICFEDPSDLDKWNHGVVRHGHLAFSADEALLFAERLTQVAMESKRMEREVEDYMEAHGEKETS